MTWNRVRRIVLSGLLGLWLASGPRLAFAGLMITVPAGGILNYGNVLVGNTAGGTITAKNTGSGTATVTFNNPTASPPFARGGTASQSGVALNATTSRTYSFTPSVRGSATTSANVSISNGGSVGVTLTGRGVAPVNAVSSTGAGPTRIGTQGVATVMVQNEGDGNTTAAGAAAGNLLGTLQGATGSSDFAGPAGVTIDLGDGGSQAFVYLYTPTGRTMDTATVMVQFSNGSANSRNQAESVLATLVGRGVGPDFQASSAPGSMLDFGLVDAGSESHLAFQVGNATSDPNGGIASLTDLTLLSATITGPDAGAFSLSGFSPGGVLGKGSASLFDLVFRPGPGAGSRFATLTLVTDQGAAPGGTGQSFDFELMGVSAVPEPSTLVSGGLAALAGVGYGLLRRRHAAV